jgi:hypothetical protein
MLSLRERLQTCAKERPRIRMQMTPEACDVMHAAVHCSCCTHWQVYSANLMTRARFLYQVRDRKWETIKVRVLDKMLTL